MEEPTIKKIKITDSDDINKKDNDALHEKASESEQKRIVNFDVAVSKDKLLDVLNSDLECGVCKNIVVQCNGVSCGHIFCWYCITRWSYDYETCPVCRLYMDYISPVIAVDNLLESVFKLYCPSLVKQRTETQQERVNDIKRREEEWRNKQNESINSSSSWENETGNDIPVVFQFPGRLQWNVDSGWYVAQDTSSAETEPAQESVGTE